jgi:ABC-2 type transport system ATP-binding protein
MDEAQRLADRAAVIRAGELVALGRPDELGNGLAQRQTITFRTPAGLSIADLPALSGDVHAENGLVIASTAEPVRDVNTLTGWALERGVDLVGLTVTRPSLEEVYLELTGGVENVD